MKFMILPLLALTISAGALAQDLAKIACNAVSEKYFINEGEEGSGPAKKEITNIILKASTNDGTVLRATFEEFEIMVDKEKAPISVSISPPPSQREIMQAYTKGGFDSDGKGPNLRLQYRINSVKNRQGNTQQATLRVSCKLNP